MELLQNCVQLVSRQLSQLSSFLPTKISEQGCVIEKRFQKGSGEGRSAKKCREQLSGLTQFLKMLYFCTLLWKEKLNYLIFILV